MITCPKCKATLPPSAAQCQFCGTDVTNVQRPAPIPGLQQRQTFGTPQWVWVAYYFASGYWILSGIVQVAEGLGAFKNENEGGIFSIVIGAVTALVGLGLIFKVEIARGIANVLCFINILFGLLGMACGLMVSAFIGPLGLLLAAMSVLNIVVAGFMIYLLGETDRR